MKFTYYGPDIATEAFGIVFPKGTAVEVEETEENAHAIAKLKNHPSFSPPKADDDAPEPAKGKKHK